ncbi:hypothetical protein V6N13_029642 [Hibiscus sabdariffa]
MQGKILDNKEGKAALSEVQRGPCMHESMKECSSDMRRREEFRYSACQPLSAVPTACNLYRVGPLVPSQTERTRSTQAGTAGANGAATLSQ